MSAKRRPKKTPAKTPGKTPRRKTAAKVGELVPQPQGGALLNGNPGNKGGTGRPPSVIRERLRGSFEERIKILEEIADDPKATPSDRIKAVDMLAKYGLGTRQEVSGPDGGAIPTEIVVTRRIIDGEA